MANTIASLQVSIGADIKRLERGLSKAQRKIRDTGRSMQRIGSRLTMAVTAPLAGVGGMALKTAADFESLQQSMNILNGSVEEGTRNFERLQEFSATTPFQLSELAEAQNMLQGFGQSADDAFESMQMIGDIAAVASGDIKGIGIAFGQAAAEGRLMTRDIRQLINQGVPAIKLLADTMGVAQSEVLDLASEGEISFEILQQSFREATSEGGMFANGMAKQAETLAGRFSTMKDNISLALGAVGDTMSGLAKNVMGSVIEITKTFRNMDDATRRLVTTIGLLAAALPPAIFLLGKLTTAIAGLATPMGLAVAAGVGLGLVAQSIIENWERFKQRFERLWIIVTNTVVESIATIVESFNKIPGSSFIGDFEGMANSIRDWKDEVPKEKDLKPFVTMGDIIDRTATGAMYKLQQLADSIFKVKQQAQGFKDMDFSFSLDADNPLETSGLSGVPEGLNKIQKAGDLTKIALGEIGQEAKVMGQALQQAATGAITNFATTLGKAFSGDLGAESFFDGIIMVVVDFANKFGKLLVAAGIAAQSFKSLISNPVAAIIAGGALIALTTAIKGLLSKGPGGDGQEAPALAQGGLAFGPTLAVVGDNRGARSNPEVIAPLDKLQGMMASSGGGATKVEGVIRGSDIHLANERGKNKFR